MEVVPPGAEGRTTAVTEALQELTARIDRKGLRTCLVMDGAHVDVNFVQVPGRIPDKEFKQAALLQAASLVPFDPETTAWDAVRQGAGTGDVSPTLVAVSTLADVTELERVMSGAGLSLDLITVAPLTLGTLVPEGDAGGNVAVMDIGARSTAVAVFQGERLLYARDTRVGSDPITDEIAEMFDGDRALAESLKRNWVLPAPGEELQPILLGGEPYVLDPARIESMHQMREELLRTLRYIQDRVGLPISRLVLTGGGSRLGGLVGYLNLPKTIQTGVADPLAVLDDVAAGVNSPLLQSVSHRLSQAVGAAYLGVRALPSRQLNLLRKQSVRKAAKATRSAPTGLGESVRLRRALDPLPGGPRALHRELLLQELPGAPSSPRRQRGRCVGRGLRTGGERLVSERSRGSLPARAGLLHAGGRPSGADRVRAPLRRGIGGRRRPLPGSRTRPSLRFPAGRRSRRAAAPSGRAGARQERSW